MLVRQIRRESERIQYYVDRLIQNYGYPQESIKTEVPLSIGSNRYQADIVVYRKEKPFILVEVKNDLKNFDSKITGRLLLHSIMLGTEYFVLTDGYIDHVFEVEKDKKIDKRLISDIPSFEQKSDLHKILTKKDLLHIKDPDQFLRSLYEYIFFHTNEGWALECLVLI